MKPFKCILLSSAFTVLAFLCAMTVGIAAQDITHPSTTKPTGPTTHVVHKTHLQNAEVIHVSGHDIVVELENGKLELLDLPKNFTFDVDGKHLTVHELTPGTKLSQEIHTVSTPQEVTTVRTVSGKVWHISPPHLILSFPGGENKSYTVPEGIVFNIDDQKKTVFDLRKGMEISATVVTVAPQETISTHTVVTGQAPPPPPNVAFEGPLLIEPPAETPAPAVTAKAEEIAPRELPATASILPLVGFFGFVLLALYAGLRISRKKTA
jgi:hypothetical protein